MNECIHSFRLESALGCGNCKIKNSDHFGKEYTKFKSGKYPKTITLAKKAYQLEVGK